MEPVRLDPADPFASVLRWLMALADALGLDPSRRAPKVELNRASAALVRRMLADWSRQLRTLILTEARRLAVALRADGPPQSRCARQLPRTRGSKDGVDVAVFFPPPRAGEVARAAGPTPEGGRQAPPAFFVGASRRGSTVQSRSRTATRRSPAEILDPAEDAALRRRTRAVLSALMDPSAAALRLARRLSRAGRRERPRSLRPPRVLGAARPDPARKPQLRPPNRLAPAVRLTERPAAAAAAPSALAL